MDDFTWPVNTESSGTGKFYRRVVSFGDGYDQSVANGINNEKQTWNATLNGTSAYVALPLAFLRTQAGGAFRWTPPRGTQGWYRCLDYGLRDVGGGYFVLTMTFQQTYKP